jgi:exosortase E/protease (VPEID-CTERM system)
MRIATLILIGAAGAADVAMQGFHSQFGWIAFNCVALGFVAATRKMPWCTVQAIDPPRRKPLAKSSTAAQLLPFLAILGAAMISKAASGGFEWLYPLRLVAAGATLWFFCFKYRELNWKFGGSAVAMGGSAFAIWLVLNLRFGPQADSDITLGLAGWPGPAKIAWLACRTTAAVTTVPIAEELAFRVFLIRHLIPGRFELWRPRSYTYFAIGVSSTAFGLLHGSNWIAGTIAGVLYAAAFCKHSRIGDAVAAHVTTNALLAAWVLFSGNWSNW